MSKLNLQNIAEDLIGTFLKAGKIAKEISQRGVKITIKSDNSPVTDGDLAVDKILNEIDNIVFSENPSKRPNIILHEKFKIIESRRDSDEYFNLSGEAMSTKIPFSFVYYLEKDYGFLSIAFSRGNNARVMIARCVAF